MTTSDLYRILSSAGSAAEFKRAILPAMPDFRRGMAELGRSLPIVITNEENRLEITPDHVRHLCSWYLEGDIDEIELEYGASCLDLADDFQYDEHVGEIIFGLSDPIVNGPINRESVRKYLEELSGDA